MKDWRTIVQIVLGIASIGGVTLIVKLEQDKLKDQSYSDLLTVAISEEVGNDPIKFIHDTLKERGMYDRFVKESNDILGGINNE